MRKIATRLATSTLVAVAVLATTASAQTYTTFDAPGASYTFPEKVYPSGRIVGSFVMTGGGSAGFIRDLTGAFTVVQYPGSNRTSTVRLAGTGLAGDYVDSGNVFHGFIRSSSGVYTNFDVPGAVNTHVVDANAKGQVVGYYSMLPNDAGPLNGYIRAANGTITTFTPKAGSQVTPVSIDATGAVVGQFYTTSYRGFIRAANGSISTFSQGPYTTHVTGWNVSSQIVGFSQNGGAYLRDSLGNFTNFRALGFLATIPREINDAGQIAGTFLDGNSHERGFFRRTDGTFVQLNPPGGAGNISLTSISRGYIIGNYGGTSFHGVLITGVH